MLLVFCIIQSPFNFYTLWGTIIIKMVVFITGKNIPTSPKTDPQTLRGPSDLFATLPYILKNYEYMKTFKKGVRDL